MDFRWIEWNVAKVERHGVAPEQAEQVARSPVHPYPIRALDGRWLVQGAALGGRLLQVVYLTDPDGTIFIIHARPLTDNEKHRYRRRHK